MADVELDLRGLRCPLPALKTEKRLASLEPGRRLQVRSDDPLATIDIPHACQMGGHRLLESSAESGGHRFLIERGASPAAEDDPGQPKL
nr:sulfurtransferase TusA family protein [Mangrovicella endophytica]